MTGISHANDLCICFKAKAMFSDSTKSVCVTNLLVCVLKSLVMQVHHVIHHYHARHNFEI